MTKLTKPQERMLADVRAAGVKVYNGRATRTVRALREAGLVTAEYDQVPHVKGGGLEITERWTVRPVEERAQGSAEWMRGDSV